MAEPAEPPFEAGPPIEKLVRRLVDTPADFLAPPNTSSTVGTDVAALVSDLLRSYGTAGLDSRGASAFRLDDGPTTRNWLRTVLVVTWLLNEPSLIAERRIEHTWALLESGLKEIASLVDADLFVTDDDRREELARRVLASLDLIPAGETLAQATDRLLTLDSGERYRVVAATHSAKERAAAVRAAMQSRAAEEAAAKASRE